MEDRNQTTPKQAFSLPIREIFTNEPANFEREFSANDLQTFRIDLPSAHVVLVGSSGSSIKVRVQGQEQRPDLLPQTLLTGKSLQVYQKLVPGIQSFWDKKKPSVIEVTLPFELSVGLSMIGGTVYVENLQGPFTGEIKFGKISGIYHGNNIRTKVYAGEIKLHGFTGSADVWMGAGNVELLWDKISTDSKVNVFCGMGDVALRFPQNQTARSVQHTGFLRNTQIQNQAGAAISASVGVGDLWVE